MAMYKVCECCGANLDFGERCDCRDREATTEEKEEVIPDGTEKRKSA